MIKKIAIILACASALCLAACGETGKEPEQNQADYATFAEYTDLEIFQDVPCFKDMERITIKNADHFGDDNYVLAITGAFPAEYKEYLQTLEEAGFKKVADNGATGIDKTVLSAYYQKDDLTLNVAFSSGEVTTYISAARNVQVSPRLTNDPSYTEGMIEGAQTTLYMHQVPEYGNCFVIQLKNGHFIVNDGGNPGDMKILIEWLEDNAPAGEIPVIEAWFVSHEHSDHSGLFKDLLQLTDVPERVVVEGFYVSQVTDENAAKTNTSDTVGKTRLYSSYFKNGAGEQTPYYRPHLGDRYYFCDITVEVPYTQEQFAASNWVDNLNVSSTWLMYNIEGQKFLLTGDTEEKNMIQVDGMYEPAYMDVDVMSLHHHCLNLYTDKLDYFQVETLLYSTWGVYSIYWPKETLEQNITIQKEYCEEYISYIEGTVKLSFPYTVGTAEILEPWYPEETERLVERQNGWLADAGLTYPIVK